MTLRRSILGLASAAVLLAPWGRMPLARAAEEPAGAATSQPSAPQAASAPAPTAPQDEPVPAGLEHLDVTTESTPAELNNVGVDEHLNAQLPLDLGFIDHNGKAVKLRDYFDGRRPVVLTLNYFRCPMLCGLVLNGFSDAVHEIGWTPGDRYQVVTVSFDPMEDHKLAYLKRRNYLDHYDAPGAEWHFLTGSKPAIDGLLDTTGFRVAWNSQRREWAHAAAIIICTPDGHISRYLYGVTFEPQTVRLSLVDAAEGKIGTTVDKILLYCFHYEDGKYVLAAANVMRAGGLLTLVLVGGLLLYLWRRHARTRAPASRTT